MIRRLVFAVSATLATSAAAPAFADLYAQLFPVTGEIRLLNKSDTSIPFVFYSISSEGGALDSSGEIWKSITENYDKPAGSTPGNGFIDPNGEWVKLLTTNQLAEGALDADGGTLPGMRAISLGHIWDPFAVEFPDLAFEVWNDDEMIPLTVELALDGDYSYDDIVDGRDFIVWQKYLDTMTSYLADGDLDGVVDLDDYVIWQQNFGLTLPLPPYIEVIEEGGGGIDLGGSTGVPEPTSTTLFLIAASMGPFVLRRRRR